MALLTREQIDAVLAMLDVELGRVGQGATLAAVYASQTLAAQLVNVDATGPRTFAVRGGRRVNRGADGRVASRAESGTTGPRAGAAGVKSAVRKPR